MSQERNCWCGNTELHMFSPEYALCQACGTLVSLNALDDNQYLVNNDEKGFYGKQYWLKHQQDDLGSPDIYARSRNDLIERNLHWLKVLLKYQLPPANVIEIGCSHGSFVALLKTVGYKAEGVEVSPWVVNFAHDTFDVPVHVGPVENLPLPPNSLDVIALMDVLEHLPDPESTLRHCLRLLKPTGFLLIQTPEYREGMVFEQFLDSNHPFLKMLISDEHLYLFSRRSINTLFRRLGIGHVNFEAAIFDQYDMFVVAGHEKLNTHDRTIWEEALLNTPNGRLALALLDVREKELSLAQKLQESEQDRVARLEQIHTLTTWLQEARMENADLKSKLELNSSSIMQQILSKLSHKFSRKTFK